ncbi:SIMPL domain-containing protein [Nocardioides dubius]|uniref:SIMPL domain-containing protein n=1 Tax=Nocardioides dubius TaxID=317019 RepID=A0ABP4ECW5_9ACTN
MAVEFTVQGRFSAFRTPERGTVRATVGLQGPSLGPVYEQVVRSLEKVSQSIAPLHQPDAGPVTWWSTQQVRTWANRPWNNQGKQLPLVHHARVGISVKFSDFAELSRWVGQHVEHTRGFTLDGVDWALTAKRQAELQREVRAAAVQDAVSRAQTYADALGLGPVTPVAIADAGMLSSGIGPTAMPAAAFMRGAAAGSADNELGLLPEDIEVKAEVDARFVS